MTRPTPSISLATGRFRWLAFSASLTTFLLIVVGGIVRVTGSGLGCGEDWPLCNGQWFPPLDLPTFIELSHRFLTALVSPLVFATAFVAWRNYRRVRWIVRPALAAAALLVIQIILGAVAVKLTLPPAVVALHLANALALFALLLIATVVAFADLTSLPDLSGLKPVSKWAGLTTLGVYVVLITGSLVTAGRASAACAGWPLCNGALAPTTAPGRLHMGHRFVAGAVGLMIAGSALQAWRQRRQNAAVAAAAMITGALFGGQVLVGAQNVLRGFPTFLNGLHLAAAAAVWASTVVFAVLAALSAKAAAFTMPPGVGRGRSLLGKLPPPLPSAPPGGPTGEGGGG